MTEGWLDDEYLMLLSEDESASYSARCEFESLLPGYTLIGFRSWDEFIVIGQDGRMYSLPTIPTLESDRVGFSLPPKLSLSPDPRFGGKIKWYVKPLCFGGAVDDEQNLTWLRLDEHAQLVAWWNEQYRNAVAEQ